MIKLKQKLKGKNDRIITVGPWPNSQASILLEPLESDGASLPEISIDGEVFPQVQGM